MQMLRQYWTSAWRNLSRNRIHGFLNIAGLTVGIAGVLLIACYIQDERSFDHAFSKADHIMQVSLDANFAGPEYNSYATPPPVGPALLHTFPQVAAYTRVYFPGNQVVSRGTIHFTEKNIFAADSNFFQLFDYPFLLGNPSTCLNDPHSIVLTESAAKRYFGSARAAMGQLLTLDQFGQPCVVAAVLKDLPETSSLQFDMLLPLSSCRVVKTFSWSWVWCQVNTFVLLTPQTATDRASLSALEQHFPAMVRVQAAYAFNRIGQPYDAFIRKGGKWDFHLQPLTRVHLYSGNMGFLYNNLGDIQYVYIFASIALVIILLACINFMNLATAQASGRLKDIGVRKVLGSLRSDLIRRFLVEAVLYSSIATAIAFALVCFLIPAFNELSGKSLPVIAPFRHGVWILGPTLGIGAGLLAGLYPAFYLTSFNPADVLKSKFVTSAKTGVLRNVLVVFQFSISIALIICTLVVYRQLAFTRTKDLGLRKDNVVIVPNAEKMSATSEEVFRQGLDEVPGVQSASITTDVPGIDFFGFTDFFVPDRTGAQASLAKDLSLTSFVVDEHFIPTLHLQLLSGRNFSREFNDSNTVILNETAVRQAGWKNPIGKTLTCPGMNGRRFTIVGIVKDFNAQSLKVAINPIALFHSSSGVEHAATSYVMAALHTDDIHRTLRALEARWKAAAPGVPFEFSFLDKDFEALYVSDEKMGEIFGVFTALSIFVACLGLLGLTMYTVERRFKEIGIRKVLGASVQSILVLLSRDFVRLILLATVIAFPVAWWAMHRWLQDFAYQVSIGWWVFALSGLLALIIAVGAISYQAIKAALANPVDSLRAE